MSVNKYRPHVFVLPEDDANRQLANGFLLNLPTRQIQVLPEAGGWARVRDCFVSDHIGDMENYESRHVILLVDFDGNLNRLQDLKNDVPAHLVDRVFVLGAYTDPEGLRQAGLGSYETIGRALADECRAGNQQTWSHKLLEHNHGEFEKLRDKVCPLLEI